MNLKFIKSLIFIVTITLSTNLYSESLSERTVLHHSSNNYGSIWVYDFAENIDKIRCLSFVPPGGIIQSSMLIDNPNKLIYDYSKMMLSGLYLNKSPKKILMIGLGGASIAKALNILLPFAKLDIIEINNDIPEIAKKYFAFEPNNNTHIFVEDGVNFVKKAKANSYDLIIIDAFDSDYIPPSFLTLDFIKDVKNILTSNGIVVVNTFYPTKYTKWESEIYNEVFGTFVNLRSQYNRVILAKKDGKLASFEDIKNKAEMWRFSFFRLGIDKNWLLEKFK